jgi:hypothetical protein
MSFFAKGEHEIVVTDPDGNEGRIWIKELNTKTEAQKLAKTVKFKMKGRKQDTKFDIVQDRLYDLYECIVRWDLKDDDGNDVPVTRQNIDNLGLYVSKQIRKELEKLHELPEDREEEDDEDDEDEDDEESEADFDSDDEDSEADEVVAATAGDPTTAG